MRNIVCYNPIINGNLFHPHIPSSSTAECSNKTLHFLFRIRIQGIQYLQLMCCGLKEDWEVIISTHLVVVIDMKLIEDSTRKLFLAN